MKFLRGIALIAGVAIALGGRTADAQAQVRPPADSTRDTLRFVLAPIEVNAVRERAAPPPVPSFEIASSVLRRTAAANPYDLMRRAGGIEVHEQGQGPGFASDVVVRGFTSDHSQDVLLVIDGVPVNLPINGHAEGYAEWDVLLPAAISSTRLIYGTASPLYGDFALGGVVEVFTAPEADGTRAGFSGSSHGDLGGWLRTGGRGEKGGHLEAVELRNNHGWRDNSENRTGNALLRGWHQLDAGRIEGGIHGYMARWDSPGFLSAQQFDAGNLKLATDATDGGDEARIVAHGRLVKALGRTRTLQATAWGLLSRWDLFLTIPEHDEVLEQTHEKDRRGAAGGQIEFTNVAARGDLTLGFSGRLDGARFDRGPSEMRTEGALEESFDGRYQSGASYVRWRRNIGQRLGIDAGARFDVIRHESLDLLADSADWQSSTRSVFGPKLGARYALSAKTALIASLSRGFRSAAGVLPDPHRPAVLAWSSDAGLQHSSSSIDMFLGVFRLEVSHERQLDPVTREVENTGSSTRQGVNARLEWTAAQALSVRSSFTYNHARLMGFFADEHETHDQADGQPAILATTATHAHGEAATHQVPGVAEYFGSLGVELRPTVNTAFTADVRVNGPYIPIGETEQTDAYSVVDVGGLLRIGQRMSLDLALHNVLDERYPELRASGFINPGVPRTLRVGLRVDR